MIEFGAGGQIVQSETTAADAPPAAEGEHAEGQDENAGGAAANPEQAAEGAQAPPPIPAVLPATNTRRKRKAKGWFCPVCRQRKSSVISYEEFADTVPAYTSCLRITTTPPSKDAIEDDHQETADITDHPLAPSSPTLPASPAPAPRGVLASLGRPGFLRPFSRQPVGDIERGQPVAAATA